MGGKFFSIVLWTSAVSVGQLHYSDEWRKIRVIYGDVLPKRIIVGICGSVKLYCGSSAPVVWRFPDHFTVSRQNSVLRHIQRSSSIVLKKLSTSDSGHYCCVGNYVDGTAFYNCAVVKVVKMLTPGVIVPSWIDVSNGKSVRLNCGSIKPVKWIGIHTFFKSRSTEDNYLIFNKIEKGKSGQYLCIGINQNKNVFHKTVRIIVDGSVIMVPGNLSEYFQHLGLMRE